MYQPCRLPLSKNRRRCSYWTGRSARCSALLLRPYCATGRAASQRAQNSPSPSRHGSLDPPLEVRFRLWPVRRAPLLESVRRSRLFKTPRVFAPSSSRAVGTLRGPAMVRIPPAVSTKPLLVDPSRCAGQGARDDPACEQGCDFHTALKLSKDTADLGLSWVA